jgi:molybdopterin converting factor small subunit
MIIGPAGERNCQSHTSKKTMVNIHICGHLTSFTGGRSQIEINSSPATVGAALGLLWSLHPGLRDRVLTEQGEVRPHVNIFVGNENIKYLRGFETPVEGMREIFILPSVSGGAN